MGIKSGQKIKLINEPEHYFQLFSDLPGDIRLIKDNTGKKDLIHYFTTSATQLKRDLKQLKAQMEQSGCVWISWPKKTSGVNSDMNENLVREIALKSGLVDVKVCAVDETWSGLKLVIRLKDRK